MSNRVSAKTLLDPSYQARAMRHITEMLADGERVTCEQLGFRMGVSTGTAIRLARVLRSAGLVIKMGHGRSTNYRLPRDGEVVAPDGTGDEIVQRRDCLMCQKPFPSEGIHNRICVPCTKTSEWRSGADFTTQQVPG